VFSKEELKAWKKAPAVSSRFSRFVPDNAVDPIFYDKAYFIAPDKRGGKPYSLLQEAMLKSHRCACELEHQGQNPYGADSAD
jgi:DNA end-binding protein Ku